MYFQGFLYVLATGFFNFYPGNGNYINLDGSTGQAGSVQHSNI